MPADNVEGPHGCHSPKTGTRATVTHVIGVTGQHEVLMVGQYTRDPAKVVSIFKSLYWYTTHKGRSEK